VRSAKEQVQGIIQEYNEDIIQMKTARHQIALTLLQEYHFVYPETRVQGWRSVLYVYDDETGIYEPRGEEFLQSKLEAIAGDFVTNQLVNEIVAKVERSASADRDCFERHPEKLVVGNGILDLHTGTLEPHTPDAYHQQRITVDWNPDAGDPERVDSFLHEIVDAGDVPTLYRLMAHTLYKEYISEKAAILLGSGQNGKSVFLEFLEQFLQPSGDNVAHRELQDFDDDDYAANNLRGRMANLATEIGEQKLTDTTMFKKLTGRDTIDAQVKFEKPVTFENYATMMFATNEMPVFGQDNHAVWRRWVYIEFPYTFNATDPDAKDPVDKQLLLDELTAQSELEALLVRCQQEIQRWHADPEAAFFDDAMPPDEIRDKMKKAAEPVYAFASTCLKPADEEAFVRKSRVREAYRAYADEQDLPTLPENTFGERLIELRDFGISPKQRRINGTMTRVYEGVEMTSRGRQVLGLDENDDDAQQGIDETEQPDSRAVVLSELREMTKENDNEPVPRAGVIWRSVGGHIGKSTAEQALEHLAKSGEIIVDGDDVMPTDI
jgi:P4 family phage/plasmid primase-like protien